MTKKQVKDLKAGDELSSGAKILSATKVQDNPMWGKAKVFIGVQYPNGKIQSKYWGRYTTVSVK